MVGERFPCFPTGIVSIRLVAGVWLLKKQIKHEWVLLIFLSALGNKCFKGKKSKPQPHHKSWNWAISFLVSVPNNLHVNIQSCAIQGLSHNPWALWCELKWIAARGRFTVGFSAAHCNTKCPKTNPFTWVFSIFSLALRSESSWYFLCFYIILISCSLHSLGCRYIQRQWPWSLPVGMVAGTTGNLGVWLVVMRSGLHTAFSFLNP